jgi:hypothetical protein
MVKCGKAEVRRLQTALRWKLPSTQRERIQMVLLREGGMTQPAIAAAMGVSLSTVNRAHMAYDDVKWTPDLGPLTLRCEASCSVATDGARI